MPDLSLGMALYERGGIGDAVKTNCFIPLESNGTKVGMDGSVPFGSIIPGETSEGQLIYAFYADTSTGLFVARFGIGGDEELINTSNLVITVTVENIEYNILLVWNATNKRYEATDQEAADLWFSQVGTDSCINVSTTPRLLIHYDFEILRNTDEL